jgi:methyl-accepting chemotaxis protein
LVGQTYAEGEEVELISDKDDAYTTSSIMGNGTSVFNITTPILFQSTEVGTIILGLSQEGLNAVKSATAWLMFLLAVITISSVAVIMFIFGGLISRPLKVISNALHSFASGDFDTRISLNRKDEIGEVFNDFNHMAMSIQDRYTSVADELAQSGIQAPERKIENSGISHMDSEDVEDATIMANSSISVKDDDDGEDRTIIASTQSNALEDEAAPAENDSEGLSEPENVEDQKDTSTQANIENSEPQSADDAGSSITEENEDISLPEKKKTSSKNKVDK